MLYILYTFAIRYVTHEIPTGINQYPFQKLEPESCSMRPDAEDNFVFLEDGTTLYIYNPNGINGYAKTKGTLVK